MRRSGVWRRPGRLAGAFSIVLVPALLFSSILLGIRLPSSGEAAGPGQARLDLGRGPLGALAPLRDDYLSKFFGGGGRSAALPAATRRGLAPSPVNDLPPPEVVHEPTNDHFGRAYPLPGVPFTARTNTVAASREQGEPGGCAPVGNTLWYRLRAPTHIGLIVDTFGTSEATSLGVFTGTSLADLQQVGCSTHPRGNSYVPFAAKAGTTYFFQVASVSRGRLVFAVRPQGVTTRAWASELGYGALFGYVSPTGRFVSLTIIGATDESTAECVGMGVTMCQGQGYVLDREMGTLSLVTVASDGTPGNKASSLGMVSADGRYAAFGSTASNLVPEDTNVCRTGELPGECADMFVIDRDADADGIFDESHPGARKTVRVSVSSDGRQGNDATIHPPLMSPDGRYVAMGGYASNLVDDDTNGVYDCFMHDRDADGDGIFDETHPGARRTWRVSVASDGSQADDPLVTTDGDELRRRADAASSRADYFPPERGNMPMGVSMNLRYFAFRSRASNLAPGDTNGAYDVFVHDNKTGKTTRVNVSSTGEQADRGTRMPNTFHGKVSDDGRYVIFNSDATNLVPGDTNDAEDLFLRDLVKGTTERLTVTASGEQVFGEAPTIGRDFAWGVTATTVAAATMGVYPLSELNHTMSADGRRIFFSAGTALVPHDENEQRDIYMLDRRWGTLTLVSVSTAGLQGNQSSNVPFISQDGSVLTFATASTNLDESVGLDGLALLYSTYIRLLPRGQWPA